ncbi:hypothetical protein A3844_03065 [Paenibacillus helianthi]|uniref:Uncharacterized protein n=1 Tax=Paenibacillus helianthi TaxID=1349432 RepID=A0ABX3EV30_9BACL|nr:hypothetical protein A3848_12990 [Paenibacillus sp. P32E]OKP90854.1 hypothetical protein A3844_03065 [Paenibacillus helianthi]
MLVNNPVKPLNSVETNDRISEYMESVNIVAGIVMGEERNQAKEQAHRQKLRNLHNSQCNPESGHHTFSILDRVIVQQQRSYNHKSSQQL